MRKIRAGLFISLDGIVEAPDQWHFPYFNGEMAAAVTALLATDSLLLGRTTYDSFAGAWPEREARGEEDAGIRRWFAGVDVASVTGSIAHAKMLAKQHIIPGGDARKIVVSARKLTFSWRNSEQLQVTSSPRSRP